MQEQFLDVIDRDEAERRFLSALSWPQVEEELVHIGDCLGRVLTRDILSPVDVPSFDRSNVDGYAVRAADTYGAREDGPRVLRRLPETIHTGVQPSSIVAEGMAVSIATGGMIPRGADAVVMIEHADEDGEFVYIRRAVTPGGGISFTGTDITRGELVLHADELLTSRETGVMAAIGVATAFVRRQPRVSIISTGDELIVPGESMRPALVYDSNSQIIADAVRELGGQPVRYGIVADDPERLREVLGTALADTDVVLLSGGTSKGAGDLSYRIVQELTDPGIVAHGVALKPGKPICLAVSRGKPVVVLPGFPTSAVFTFHEFVAPVIRKLAGLPGHSRNMRTARMAVRVNSEVGRTEYLLVGLVPDQPPADGAGQPKNSVSLVAYPMGKGSGSVTTFSRADGFATIGRHVEIVDAGELVEVELLGKDLPLADLVVIGSHCVGLDFLLGKLQKLGWRIKFLSVGSTGGLEAARRGECDLAGIHLLDSVTGTYNRPFLPPGLELIPGYMRRQGIVYRIDDLRLSGRSLEQMMAAIRTDDSLLMVNRNAGSGTRVLVDRMLGGLQPPGYANQPRNHNAVAAAVVQGRADWGITLASIAARSGLGFAAVADEHFDFAIPAQRLNRASVRDFIRLLQDPELNREIAELVR